MTTQPFAGSLGALALGARASIKGTTGVVRIPVTRDALVDLYEQNFGQVTVLATYRDLFTKIGLDFDRGISFAETSFDTNIEAIPTLPHSGIGPWGKELSNALDLSDDREWRALMLQARDFWLAMHRELYLGTAAEDAEDTLSGRLRLRRHLHPSFSGYVRSVVKTKKLREAVKQLGVAAGASVHPEGIVSIYLHATFGTHSINWAQCITAIESVCTERGSSVEWSSPGVPGFAANGQRFLVDNTNQFGKGPHFELMNAELLASRISTSA